MFCILGSVMHSHHHTACELKEIYNHLKYDDREGNLQLDHRMTLVDLWSPESGDHILEIGCGQGETTVVLAAAAGVPGRVLAVDNGLAGCGRPATLGESHAFIKSTALGGRIEFLLSTDLLTPRLNFPEQAFDLVVFSHSAWYMSSPTELYDLFARVRPWARRLGYAEWDLRPRSIRQVPHMLAALLQARMHRMCPQTRDANVRSVILSKDARVLAEKAGWTIMQERVLNTSTPLGYGKSWEIHNALEMAEQLAISDCHALADGSRETLLTEMGLLQQLSDETQNLSLSTYAFLAV